MPSSFLGGCHALAEGNTGSERRAVYGDEALSAPTLMPSLLHVYRDLPLLLQLLSKVQANRGNVARNCP